MTHQTPTTPNDIIRQCRAFTLIELLTVIFIISILTSMMMPSIGSAKRKAHQIACMNNQKQIGIAGAAYAIDWNGWHPVAYSPHLDMSSEPRENFLATVINDELGGEEDSAIMACNSDNANVKTRFHASYFYTSPGKWVKSQQIIVTDYDGRDHTYLDEDGKPTLETIYPFHDNYRNVVYGDNHVGKWDYTYFYLSH